MQIQHFKDDARGNSLQKSVQGTMLQEPERSTQINLKLIPYLHCHYNIHLNYK